MFSYDFTLTSGDKNVGTVYLPNEDTTNIPVIIYCHGWGGSRKLWAPTEKLCERAIKENIALVTFDFYGGGDTGGDYTQMTYKRWKENLCDILTWIINQTFSDGERIGCYAFSSGSTAALRLAAEDNRIKFLISVGTCISSHIFMRTGGPAKWLADNMQLLLSGGTFKDFGIEFLVDTVSNAPIYKVHETKCPTLFLQGTADNPYRCADAKMAHDIMKQNNLQATHIELKDGTHELDNMVEEAINNVFNWLTPIL